MFIKKLTCLEKTIENNFMELVENCELCGKDNFYRIGYKGRFQSEVHSVVCMRCGLVFENPRMEEKEISEYYSGNYHPVYGKKEIPLDEVGMEKAIERLSFIGKDVTVAGKKVLEIGCATGAFLNLCKEMDAEITGIEPDRKYAEYGNEKNGLNIFNGTLEDYKRNQPDSDSTFDIICMFHVLEHLPNLFSDLQWLYCKLSPDGLLYLEVPNLLTTWRWLNQSPKKFLRPPHLYNFTWSTLRMLLSSAKFNIIAEDKSVSRRIRILAEKTRTERRKDNNKGNNPYLVISFFYLWKSIYMIVFIVKALIKKAKISFSR